MAEVEKEKVKLELLAIKEILMVIQTPLFWKGLVREQVVVSVED